LKVNILNIFKSIFL